MGSISCVYDVFPCFYLPKKKWIVRVSVSVSVRDVEEGKKLVKTQLQLMNSTDDAIEHTKYRLLIIFMRSHKVSRQFSHNPVLLLLPPPSPSPSLLGVCVWFCL